MNTNFLIIISAIIVIHNSILKEYLSEYVFKYFLININPFLLVIYLFI